MRPNSIPEGHLLLSLDTVEPVDAEQALALMHALLVKLRQIPEIGVSAHIEIVNLSRGTIWAQVAIIIGTLVAGAGIIQAAADAIRAELEQGQGELAKQTARTLNLYKGGNCTIRTQNQDFTVGLRTMPARETVAKEPPVPPAGFEHSRDGDADVQQRGKYVLTRKDQLEIASTKKGGGAYTNIPIGEAVERSGKIVMLDSELHFVQEDGDFGRVDRILSEDEPPRDTLIKAMVTATRGERGGYADRGISIDSWTTLEDADSVASHRPTLAADQPAEGLEGADSSGVVEPENARYISLVGQLDNSYGVHPFEFIAKAGDTYFAREANDFHDMIALGQDVFIEASLTQADGQPLLYIHRLRIID